MTAPKLQPAIVTTPNLSASDRELLARLESEVENSVMSFCVALAKIRDYNNGIFWKDDYDSFPEYVKLRFGYSEQHAGRLANAGGFVRQLEDAKPEALRPIRESQVRPLLAKLLPAHVIPCWEIITEKKAPSELTADMIKAEVLEYRKRIPNAQLPPTRKRDETRPSPVKVAKDRSHIWLKKLKVSTVALPRAVEILMLLERLENLIDGKTNQLVSGQKKLPKPAKKPVRMANGGRWPTGSGAKSKA